MTTIRLKLTSILELRSLIFQEKVRTFELSSKFAANMHINIYNQLVAIPIPSENFRLQKIVCTFTSISTKTCIDLSIKDYATKITNILMLINLTGSCLHRDVCTQFICMLHLHSSIKIHLFHLSSFLFFLI